MNLGAWHPSVGPLLRDCDGPGRVYGLNLLVELEQLLVSEDLVPVPPGLPQLIQQPTNLRGLLTILLRRLKIKPWFTRIDPFLLYLIQYYLGKMLKQSWVT